MTREPALREPPWVRRLLIGFTVLFLGGLLVAPLILVFSQALARGLAVYLAALTPLSQPCC